MWPSNGVVITDAGDVPEAWAIENDEHGRGRGRTHQHRWGGGQQTKARATWLLLTKFSNRFASDDDYEAYALIVQQATEASERVIKHALSVRAGGDDARGSRGVVDERLASSFVDSPRLRHPPV